MKRYSLFDHTADLGIEFFGESREKLFISAGTGLFDVIAGIDSINPDRDFHIRIEGMDMEDLLVNWLRELLYLNQVKKMLISEFSIQELSDTFLDGIVRGEPFKPEKHDIKKEVKAVTYHGLEVGEDGGIWKARVIFDV